MGTKKQGPTHQNQVAPFNLKFSSVSASAYNSNSYKSFKAQHPKRKLEHQG